MPEIPTASFHDPRIALSHWNELVRDTGVPTPDTVSIPVTDSPDGLPQWDTDDAVAAVKTLGGEAFVRSDYKSAALESTAGSRVHQRNGEWRNIAHHPGECRHDLERQYDTDSL